MKNTTFLIISFFLCFNVTAQLPPEIYSWKLNTNGATGYNNFPSNVQQVQYSTNNVYVSASCIPGYDIGPWAGNPNVPANQNFVFKITRNPQQNTGTAIATGLGHIGVFSNGVSIFNPKDAFSYMNQNVWFQNAVVVEGPSFDNCLGHPAPNGEYHHHLNPTCLYLDSLNTQHSPIVGFAFDGFPVYGAFAYANTNGSGGIKRMQSSYRKRNMSSRTTLPNGSTASSPGPAVSSTYPLGYYVEDYEYLSGSGDLDAHNGRFCVTPDYPNGKYCYFVTLDSNLVAEYPYVIGPSYYGTVQAGNTGPGSGHNTINEAVVSYTGSTGLQQQELDYQVNVFPNPAGEHIYVSSLNSTGNMYFTIYDQLGQSVLITELPAGSSTSEVSVLDLSPGIYYFRINCNESSYNGKLQIR